MDIVDEVLKRGVWKGTQGRSHTTALEDDREVGERNIRTDAAIYTKLLTVHT